MGMGLINHLLRWSSKDPPTYEAPSKLSKPHRFHREPPGLSLQWWNRSGGRSQNLGQVEWFVGSRVEQLRKGGGNSNSGTPKWMVKIIKQPIKMDDLGGFPIFLETPKWWQLKDFWNFHPDPWGNDPIWRAYFLDGLVKNHQPGTICQAILSEKVTFFGMVNSRWPEPQWRSRSLVSWPPIFGEKDRSRSRRLNHLVGCFLSQWWAYMSFLDDHVSC